MSANNKPADGHGAADMHYDTTESHDDTIHLCREDTESYRDSYVLINSSAYVSGTETDLPDNESIGLSVSRTPVLNDNGDGYLTPFPKC